MTSYLHSDCETCQKKSSALCSAIQARTASVWPLVPEVGTLMPGCTPTEVSRKRGRFGVLHSGLLMRVDSLEGGAGPDIVSIGEPLCEPFCGERETRVTAMVPSKVCWFDVHQLEAVALRDKRLETALALASSSMTEMRQTLLRIRESLLPVERVAALLVLVSRRLAGPGKPEPRCLTLECRPKDLADILDLTVQALMEAREVLVEDGLIVIRDSRTVELRDISALTRLAKLPETDDDEVRPEPGCRDCAGACSDG